MDLPTDTLRILAALEITFEAENPAPDSLKPIIDLPTMSPPPCKLNVLLDQRHVARDADRQYPNRMASEARKIPQDASTMTQAAALIEYM